jgi:hypothetical protein
MKKETYEVTFGHCTIEVNTFSFRSAIILATAELMKKGEDTKIISIKHLENGAVMEQPRITIEDLKSDEAKEGTEEWLNGLHTPQTLTDDLKEEIISEFQNY